MRNTSVRDLLREKVTRIKCGPYQIILHYSDKEKRYNPWIEVFDMSRRHYSIARFETLLYLIHSPAVPSNSANFIWEKERYLMSDLSNSFAAF